MTLVLSQCDPVTPISFDWPQSAGSLVDLAKGGVDLAGLIMGGTTTIESWLIAQRVLPALRDKGLATLCFNLDFHHQEKRSALCLPLPDGSAFICNALGVWSPLKKDEAAHEIQYIGSRYAPGDHWQGCFDACLCLPDGTSHPLTPCDVASFWAELTGERLSGFASGILDHLEAIGHGVVDKVFTTQGRLGL
ncbi:hypothetical protein [Dechloromonas sp. HYN0024]|uniref:hypothetical protein n=1 Tax=Dechloromonas sp. HYN0024 TaxID=2231055 RepID=UPI000E4360CE|nr:hypothetical protein [Dechloromonas sp. HYN0024]AXS80205.1 hypothetical protein HYN24_09340 [Dechloromonas sp. HYN0024]